MNLHPIQFLTSHMADNYAGRPEAKFDVGAQVHDTNGRPGIVTDQHVDHRHYNVRWGRGNVSVHHEDELR